MGVWKKFGRGAKAAGKVVLHQALGDASLFDGRGKPVIEGWRTTIVGVAFVVAGAALLGWAEGQEQLGGALLAAGTVALLGADAGVIGRAVKRGKPDPSRSEQ